jgi:alpha-tubulin suppressor-like RCC1 family protein
MAWGADANAEVGNGTQVDNVPTPVPVSLPSNVSIVQVATESQTSFALTSNGLVYGWGLNNSGQVGIGTTATVTVPVLVPIPQGAKVKAIAGSASSALALTTGGLVYTWGSNGWGALGGQGAGSQSLVPVIVPFPTGTIITAIARGGNSLALTSTGLIYSWGIFPIGNGQQGGSLTPVLDPLPPGTVKAIAATDETSMALTTTGQVYSWGYNNSGELGIGGATNTLAPLLALLPSGIKATAIAAQGGVEMALTSGSQVYSWGDTESGQASLGDGSNGGSSLPVPALLPAGIKAKSLGSLGNTAFALTTSGQVLSWGYGALGDGIGYSTVPVTVKLPTGTTASGLSQGDGLTELAITST